MKIGINVYAVWDEFGYIASSPDCANAKSKNHHLSARQAAEDAAKQICGTNRYRIIRGPHRNHYIAEVELETNDQAKLPL